MRIIIAGAGQVGRSIARELLSHGHQVTVIDQRSAAGRQDKLPEVEWVVADACEIGVLESTGVGQADVVVAATGDDKANLVVSLLAKTEFGVPRTVALVNNPRNEWMFDDAWGVDVAVSTPRVMTSMVDEAVSVGDLVPILTFHRSKAQISEITLPADSPLVGRVVGSVPWPVHTNLICIIRDAAPIDVSRDDTMEADDQLLFVTGVDADVDALALLLRGGTADGSTDQEPGQVED